MCFSQLWLENLLIWLVVVGVTVGVLLRLVPWVFTIIGIDTGPLLPIIRLIVMGVVAIAVIVFTFDLLGCLHFGALRPL